MQQHINYRKAPPWFTNSLSQLRELTKNEIVIKNADKNMGVTVQDRLTYEHDCLSQLNDLNVYYPIDSDSVDYSNLFNELQSILTQHNKLYIQYGNQHSDKLTPISKYMLQLNTTNNIQLVQLARFYIIYKVHKATPVGRPICSNINTVTYFASKYVDKILQPIMKMSHSYVQSSQSIVALLDSYEIPPEYTDTAVIVCADVTSLYPNIPIETGINYMRDRLIFLYGNTCSCGICKSLSATTGTQHQHLFASIRTGTPVQTVHRRYIFNLQK